MQETGLRNSAYGADKFGFKDLSAVHWNLTAPTLYEHAIAAGEAAIVAGRRAVRGDRRPYRPLPQGQAHGRRRADREHGLVGRQPQDQPSEVPVAATPTSSRTRAARRCSRRISTAAPIRRTGSRPASSPNSPGTRCSSAQLLIRPERSELARLRARTHHHRPAVASRPIPSATACRTETVIAIDFTRKIVLIGGTSYAGEMKKSVFTTLNYLSAGARA